LGGGSLDLVDRRRGGGGVLDGVVCRGLGPPRAPARQHWRQIGDKGGPETGEPLVRSGTRIVVACGDGATAGRVLDSIPDRRVGHWQRVERGEGCYAWYHVPTSGLD
jgi:hypothetical protein